MILHGDMAETVAGYAIRLYGTLAKEDWIIQLGQRLLDGIPLNRLEVCERAGAATIAGELTAQEIREIIDRLLDQEGEEWKTK